MFSKTLSTQTLQFEQLSIEVSRKKIKSIRLKLLPTGQIRLSAPMRVSEDILKQFIASKLEWIQKNQYQVRSRNPKVYQYISGEAHILLGKAYQLDVIPANTNRGKVVVESEYLRLYVPKTEDRIVREKILTRWLRKQLLIQLAPFIQKWEKLIGVTVEEYRVKKMKTRWGTCNPLKKRIWFSLELIKKDQSCLEYIVVHEMVHFLEASHNKRFYHLMDLYLPSWKVCRKLLSSR